MNKDNNYLDNDRAEETFELLVCEYLEGHLSTQDAEQFKRYLNDKMYVSRFVEICKQEQIIYEYLTVGNDRSANDVGPEVQSISDSEVWRQLAAHETTAPAVLPIEEALQFELIRKVQRERTVRKINKPLLWTTLASLAALVLMIIYIQVVPRHAVEMVATVNDSMNSNEEFTRGDRLTNRRQPYWLQKGVLEIEFDYGAKVVIEGPSLFRLESAEKLRLDTGRAYARVPGCARGFMIGTPSSTVIDLGTEFGVQVEIDGTSSVHLLKGQATLIPGAKGKTGESQLLTKGQALQVGPAGAVNEIPVQQDAFVRGFSSENRYLWRGEPVLSIVALPATGTDAATGISPAKKYTHLLDFGGGTPAVINGVSFTQVNHPEIKQDLFEDADNRFRLQKNGYPLLQTYTENKPQAWVFSDGGIADLLTDFTYQGSNENEDHYTLSLTGLQPGTPYTLRLYYCPHSKDRGSRDVTLFFSGDGKPSQITINENEKGAHYVRYDYIAAGTEVSVRFETISKDWQLYGVTNEVITHE